MGCNILNSRRWIACRNECGINIAVLQSIGCLTEGEVLHLKIIIGDSIFSFIYFIDFVLILIGSIWSTRYLFHFIWSHPWVSKILYNVMMILCKKKRLQKQIFMMQKQYLPMLKEKTFHFTSKAPITNWHKTAGSWRKFTA